MLAPILDWTSWRAEVKACRACKGMIPTPKHGLGPRPAPSNGMQRPALAIVGQNPPTEPARALDGGWMIHYPALADQYGPHEKLLQELLGRLGLRYDEVYATQATKCPTKDNRTDVSCMDTCREKWLTRELLSVNPRVLLAFGIGAGHQTFSAARGLYAEAPPDTLHPSGSWPPSVSYDLPGVTPGVLQNLGWRQGAWLRFPHPSVVGRFLQPEPWLTAIVEAYHAASAWSFANPREVCWGGE